MASVSAWSFVLWLMKMEDMVLGETAKAREWRRVSLLPAVGSGNDVSEATHSALEDYFQRSGEEIAL